jgi:hypothetical protein
MGYLLFLQTLDQRDGDRAEHFISTTSVGLCFSTSSAGIC